MRRTACLLYSLWFSSLALGKSSEVELQGYAEWRRDGFLVVDGQRVVPGEEVDLEVDGRKRAFQSIPLGYEVKVRGVRLADGTVLAREMDAKRNGSAFYESPLRASADSMEEEFRRHGRVAEHDSYGRALWDYGKLLESGPEVDRARAIAARLAPPYLDPEELRVYVVDNDEWNAMAAPNGSIYVWRGLLRDLDDDEVGIVLGHELVHATHEHSRRSYKKAMLVNLIGMGASTAAEAIDRDGARLATQIGIYATTLAWMNGYSRSEEDQADRVGLRYAYEAGFDASKGPALWKRFAAKYRGLPKAVNFFLGGHSVASDRAKHLEEEIRRNYSGQEARRH
jgi:Zn-dependent protease with chaperone function